MYILNIIHRINFTLDDLAPASPAHSYFCSCIHQNYKNPETGTVIRINGTKQPIRFPQYFNYDRIKELVCNNYNNNYYYYLI